MTQQERPIIIGGGMAGLTAALHLGERGVSPLVLEAHPVSVGGRLAGYGVVTVDGWTFRDEHGMHGIWASYLNLKGMLKRHNIYPDLIASKEETWIYRRKNRVSKAAVGSALRRSWLPAPLHYLALITRFDFLKMALWTPRDWLSLLLVWYSLILPLGINPLAEWQPMGDMKLDELVRWWPDPLKAFFLGLARNGLSAQPDEVPVAGFVAFLRYYTLLRRDAWTFSYMAADGGTAVMEPMAHQVRQLGGEIWLDAQALSIAQTGENLWSLQVKKEQEVVQLQAKHLILATDSPNTAKLLNASAFAAEATANLYWPKGVETIVIRFWFDRAPTVKAESGIFTGDFVIHNYFWLHLIQTPYKVWHEKTGGSAIEVHIYGPREQTEKADYILLTHALTDVCRGFPELRHGLIHQVIRRNPAAHTLLSLGPQAQHLGIETPWDNLFCCGDWVRHPSPSFFLERACVTGIEAANAVLQRQNLSPWPLENELPPEPFAGMVEKGMLKYRRWLRRRRKSASG